MVANTQKRIERYVVGMILVLGAACLAKAAYIPAKGVAADILLTRAWERSQSVGAPVLPWPWMDAQPLARLSVPHLGESEIMLDVGTNQALGFAPAHMEQTPRPGEPGLSVIAAHKNTHFAFLEHLRPDDRIEVEGIDGAVDTFKVTHFEIVDKDYSGIDLNTPPAQPSLALVTCYPFNALSYGGPLRYVVYAQKLTRST